MRAKYIILGALPIIAGCAAGEAVLNLLGGNTPPGQQSPLEQGFSFAAPYMNMLVPGVSALVLGLAKVAHTAVRTNKALFEATQSAIDSGSLVKAASSDEVKTALKTAQSLHNDSKLLAKEFKNFKAAQIKGKQ